MPISYNGYSLPVDEPILDQDVKAGDYHHSTDPRGIDTYIVEVPALPGEQPHTAEVPVTTGRTSFFDVTFQSANTHMGPAPQILPHENNYYFDISYDSKNGGAVVKGATLHDPSVLENHAVLSGTFDQMTQDLVAIFTPSLLHDPLTGEGIHATRTAGFGTDYGWHGQSQTDNYIINYDDHQTLLHALLDSQIFPPSFFSVSFGAANTPRQRGITEAMFADLRAYIVEHIPRLPTYDAKSHAWGGGTLPEGTSYADLVHNYTDLMKQTVLDPREYFKWEINKYFYHMGYDGNQNFQTPEIQAFVQPALAFLGQEEVNQLVQKAFTEGAIQKEKDKPVSFWKVAGGILIGIAIILVAPELGGVINEALGVTVAESEAAAAAAAAADGVAFEGGAVIGADAMIGTVSATSLANNFTGSLILNSIANGGDVVDAFKNAGINAISGAVGGIMGQAFDGSRLAQTVGSSFTNATLRGDNPLTAAAQSFVQYEVASTLGSISQNSGQIMPENIQQGLGNIAAQGLVRQNVDLNQVINAFIPTGPSKPQQPTPEQMQTQQAVNQAFNTMDQQNLNYADGDGTFITPPALLNQQVNETNFNAQQARQAMNDIFNSQANLGNGLQVGNKTLMDGSTLTYFQNSLTPAFIRSYQNGATVFNSGNGTGGYGTDANGNVFGWGSRANQDAAFALARQQGDSTFAFDKGDGKGMQPYNTTTAAEVQAQRAAQEQAAARAAQLAQQQQQQQQAASQSSASAAPADAGGGRGSVIPPTVNSPEFAAQQNEQNNAGRGSINPPTVNSPQFAAQQAEQNNTGRGSINPPTVNSSQFAAQQAEMNARATDLQPAASNPMGDFSGATPVMGADSSAAAAFNNSAPVNAVTSGVKNTVEVVSNVVNLAGAATGLGADGATKQLYGTLYDNASSVVNKTFDGTYANQLMATAQRNASNLDTFNSNFMKNPDTAITQGSQQFENAINHLTTEPVLNGAAQLTQHNLSPTQTAGALFQVGAGLAPGAQVLNEARAGANAVTRGLDAAGTAGESAVASRPVFYNDPANVPVNIAPAAGPGDVYGFNNQLRNLSTDELSRITTDPAYARQVANQFDIIRADVVQRDAAALLARSTTPTPVAGVPATLDQMASQAQIYGLNVTDVPVAYRFDSRPLNEIAAAGGATPNPAKLPGTLIEHTDTQGTSNFVSFSTTSSIDGATNDLKNLLGNVARDSGAPRVIDSPVPLQLDPVVTNFSELRAVNQPGVVVPPGKSMFSEGEVIFNQVPASSLEGRSAQFIQNYTETLTKDAAGNPVYHYQLDNGTAVPTSDFHPLSADAGAGAAAPSPHAIQGQIPMNVSHEVAPSSVVTATSPNATWQNALDPQFRSEIYTIPKDTVLGKSESVIPSLNDPTLTAKFELVAQRAQEQGLNVNMNALFSGSNSVSLQGMADGKGLLSAGGQRVQGNVPFSGEGSVFRVEPSLGQSEIYHPNVSTVSTTTAADLPVAVNYAQAYKGWTPEISLANEQHYNQLVSWNIPPDQLAMEAQRMGYSPQWEAARREKWATLTPQEQNAIANSYPVLYEINPVNRTVQDFVPGQLGTLKEGVTEIGVQGGIFTNEVIAVHVPTDKIPEVQAMLAQSGNTWTVVKPIEPIQVLAKEPWQWIDDVSLFQSKK